MASLARAGTPDQARGVSMIAPRGLGLSLIEMRAQQLLGVHRSERLVADDPGPLHFPRGGVVVHHVIETAQRRIETSRDAAVRAITSPSKPARNAKQPLIGDLEAAL